jgi:YfiH family protein
VPVAGGGAAVIVFTTRADGDLAVDGDPGELAARRARVVDAPWTWLRQMHGARVVTVAEPGDHAGAEADAAVTDALAVPIAVHAADCAPIALVGDRTIGVVHAGWHGLVAGVVGAAVRALRAVDGSTPRAVLGPCIRADRYEFGAADLARVEAAVGPAARGRTADGALALDLPAAVRAALAGEGVHELDDLGLSTADAERWFSHRLRRDTGRHALVAWLEP